jgi:transcriptional regulator with XRE-family HTH domain
MPMNNALVSKSPLFLQRRRSAESRLAGYVFRRFVMLYDFNAIIHEMRKTGVKRKELANLLGITDNYLYMLAKGIRQPGARIIERVSELLDLSPARFMRDEIMDNNGLRAIIDLKGKLDRERYQRRCSEKRSLELEWEIEHLTALVTLHISYENIMCQHKLSMSEKMKRVEKLARSVAHGGEFTFSEMLAVFRVSRSVLKRWLDLGKQLYQCRLDDSKTVMANTPGEAALYFVCFDCEENMANECRSYGNEKRPENIIELLVSMDVNGICNRTEQSELLGESYGINLLAHEISEIMRKHKSGLNVPEKAFFMNVGEKKPRR